MQVLAMIVFLLVLILVWAWQGLQGPSATGAGRLIGRCVKIRTADGPDGRVLLDGAWWSVRCRAGGLRPGQVVRVVQLNGLQLVVEPEHACALAAR